MNIRINDYGIIFEETIVDDDSNAVNISTATNIYFTFEDPNGSKYVHSGTFTTNGTDGRVRYIIDEGLFNIAGVWQYQVNVITPFRNWNSCISSFFIEDLI